MQERGLFRGAEDERKLYAITHTKSAVTWNTVLSVTVLTVHHVQPGQTFHDDSSVPEH